MTAEQRRKKLVENKAFVKGQMNGIEFILHVMAWVMVEDMKEDPEKVQKVLDLMEDFCTDFEKGNIRYKDMVEVLEDEHHISISFGKRER